MTAADWANIAYSYVFVFGALCTGFWYVFKHGVDRVIDNHLIELKEGIREELSIVQEMDRRLDRIEYALYNDGKTGLVQKVDSLMENQQKIKTDVEVMKVRIEYED